MKLEVKNITKSFGDKEVLKGVSFYVESGAALGLLGRNGAGKTTTIRIIMGLFEPNSGEVLLDGKPLDIREANVGYMPEERGLYPKKTVIEQLAYFGELRGMTKQDAIKSADALLERLDMTEYRGAKLSTLSKGNQQKIQLVVTLINDPDIVILDEPFSGLDPVNAMLLKDIVKEQIEKGKIVIFSSHQMNYIEEFCNEIVILNSGVIAVSGAIKDIKKSMSQSKVLLSLLDKGNLSEKLNESTVISSLEDDEEGLVVTLKPESSVDDLIKVVTNSTAKVNEIKALEPSLAEIFVDYTEVDS